MLQKTILGNLFSGGSMLLLGLVACLVTGCADPNAAEKDQKQSIIGRKTQEIGEFDADGDAEIANQQVEVSANPLAAAVPTGTRRARLANRLFNARYNFLTPSMIGIRKTMRSLWRGLLKPITSSSPSFPAATSINTMSKTMN